jgi:hypothetical protein
LAQLTPWYGDSGRVRERCIPRNGIPHLRCARQCGDGRTACAPRIAGASWYEGADSRTGTRDGQSTLDRRDRSDTAPFAGTERPRLPPAACGPPSGECPQRPLRDGYAVRQWRPGGVRQLRLQRMTVAVCCLGRGPSSPALGGALFPLPCASLRSLAGALLRDLARGGSPGAA